jgi:hypothetical protein
VASLFSYQEPDMLRSRHLYGLFTFAFTAIAIGQLGSPTAATGQLPGKGKGAGDPAMKADMEVFHFLLDNRADVRRTVKLLPEGVETVTESDKPEVAKKIREHVAAMHDRVKSGKGIHLRDPLFAEIFKNYDKVVMKVERTDKGVKVTETSDDPKVAKLKVAKLIQTHADVVSKFMQNGHQEVRKNHALPPEKSSFVFPVIKNRGGAGLADKAPTSRTRSGQRRGQRVAGDLA